MKAAGPLKWWWWWGGTRPEMILPPSTVWPPVWLLLPLEMKGRGKGGQGEGRIRDGVALYLAFTHTHQEHVKTATDHRAGGRSETRDRGERSFISALSLQTDSHANKSCVEILSVYSFFFLFPFHTVPFLKRWTSQTWKWRKRTKIHLRHKK